MKNRPQGYEGEEMSSSREADLMRTGCRVTAYDESPIERNLTQKARRLLPNRAPSPQQCSLTLQC